jgi:hypothetical protein
MNKQHKLPILVFILTFMLLASVQIKVERPMLLAECFLADTAGEGFENDIIFHLNII